MALLPVKIQSFTLFSEVPPSSIAPPEVAVLASNRHLLIRLTLAPSGTEKDDNDDAIRVCVRWRNKETARERERERARRDG